MSADFLDSNIVLYTLDETNAEKRRIATDLVSRGIHDGSICISYQVVQEVLNTLSRKFQPVASPAEKRQMLEDILLPLMRVMPSQALYSRAIDIQERYQYQFYDSLIIGAALEAGGSRLYSEDLQAGQRIQHLTIANPFAHL